MARASVTHSGILGGHGCPLRVGPHGHRWGWSPEVSPAWPGMQRPQGLPLVPAQHSSDSRARNPPSTPAYLGSPALHSSPGPSSVLPSPCDCAPGADSLCPGLCCSSGPQPSVRPPTTAAQVPSHTCHIFKGSSAWRKDKSSPAWPGHPGGPGSHLALLATFWLQRRLHALGVSGSLSPQDLCICCFLCLVLAQMVSNPAGAQQWFLGETFTNTPCRRHLLPPRIPAGLIPVFDFPVVPSEFRLLSCHLSVPPAVSAQGQEGARTL